ncbi:HMG box protein [Verticillium alfalfae VaMs.102]|uniref:HMG box protein n=1 Tax=Verticillium alfalfae (strain VaMs.102 / ATCC MYA-4576 / FGSC 10136) TaxID=526221 RepID=C9SJX8_VERA1|nr:HMG box protein [Verticillium alfalfae VaMs.102]EEY18996.1 HMG box protein [Verticillium alfalfae VaMs.102]
MIDHTTTLRRIPTAPRMGKPAAQPYSTPDTSPPTPSRSSDMITTRSGLTIQKRATTIKPLAAHAPRVEKASPRKKKERSKVSKKMDGVQKPLSELARENPQVFVADINAYVNRPIEERLKEVEESKTPGKIKRPMNAFMLYRKAYQNLAKSLCTQNNHQVVSQVCGSGWPLESELIRQQFNDWAKLERLNHQEAHPGYKFTPSKPKPKARVEDDQPSDDGNLDGFDWAAGPMSSRGREMKARRPQGQYDAPPSIYHSYAGAAGSPPLGFGIPSHSMYQYSNPGKPPPAPYTHSGLPPGQYYQQSVQQRHDGVGFVEDVVIRRPQSPTMAYASMPQSERHDAMGHFGHLQHHVGGLESFVDTGMIGADALPYGAGGYSDPLLDGHHRWPNPLDLSDARQDLMDGIPGGMYDDSYLDPQLQLLRGQDSSWKVEELDGSHFSSWMDPSE